TSIGSSPPRAAAARTPKEGRYQAPYPTAVISKPGQGCWRWVVCATRYFCFSLQALRRNVEKSLPIAQLQLGTDMQPFVGKGSAGIRILLWFRPASCTKMVLTGKDTT